MFPTDTIMGKVLNEVTTDKNNKEYMELIDDLILDINTSDFLDYNGPNWKKHGLMIHSDLSHTHTPEESNWTYIETDFDLECSWLVYALEDIYAPSPKVAKRLFGTIGYLIGVYADKYEDIGEVLRMTAMVSVVWLHQDHLKDDQFLVHPVSLPDFGKEF